MDAIAGVIILWLSLMVIVMILIGVFVLIAYIAKGILSIIETIIKFGRPKWKKRQLPNQ